MQEKREKDNKVRMSAKKVQQGNRWVFEKPLDKYVNAVRMTLDTFEEAVLVASGSGISRAVDLALHKTLENAVEIKDIKVYPEKMSKEVENEGKKGLCPNSPR